MEYFGQCLEWSMNDGLNVADQLSSLVPWNPSSTLSEVRGSIATYITHAIIPWELYNFNISCRLIFLESVGISVLNPIRRGIENFPTLNLLPVPDLNHGFVVLKEEAGKECLPNGLATKNQ
jgi:hypothetical protein